MKRYVLLDTAHIVTELKCSGEFQFFICFYHCITACIHCFAVYCLVYFNTFLVPSDHYLNFTTCYSCEDIRDPKACHHIVDCPPNEVKQITLFLNINVLRFDKM